MSVNRTWLGYRLDVPNEVNRFNLIKTHIITFVEQNNLKFWVTNYRLRNSPNPHIQFRVYVDSIEQELVENYLTRMVEDNRLLDRSEATIWDPFVDAGNRIRNVQEFYMFSDKDSHIMIGDMLVRSNNVNMSSNAEERTNQLASIYQNIGEATKAFYSALSEKPKDPHVMSLAIHILLNSLTYGGPDTPSEESNIRGYPTL